MMDTSFETIALIVGLITIGGSSISAGVAFWKLFDRISKIEWELKSMKRNIKRLHPRVILSDNGDRD